MNPSKAELKIVIANEIGCRLDDMLEANQKDLYRLEGAKKAFQSMGQAIEALMKVVDQEMDEGKFDLEAATQIKKFVSRAHQMSINLSIQAENNTFMQLGRIQAMDAAVQATKKFKDEELAKLATLQKALEDNKAKPNGANGVQESGTQEEGRPGASIKERRLAEEQAEAAQAKPAEPPPEAEKPVDPKPADPPKKSQKWVRGKRVANP